MKTAKLRAKQATSRTANSGKRQATKPAGRAATVDEILNPPSLPPTSPRHVPAKWRWHYGVLLALQSRLLRERRESLSAAEQPLELHSLSLADSGTDQFDHDLALAQLSTEQNALYEVNEALQRILDGSYGTCDESGRPIPGARLRAVPWTRFGKEVEVRLESKGNVCKPHLGAVRSVRAKPTGSLDEEESPSATDESLRQVSSRHLEVKRRPAESSPQRSRNGGRVARRVSRAKQRRHR